MMEDRLNPALEVSAFIRRAEAQGGVGTLLNKGDGDRGTLLLLIAERGVGLTCLERMLGTTGRYEWQRTGPPAGDSVALSQYVARRRQSDPDCWILELDIPSPERFIAETTSMG